MKAILLKLIANKRFWDLLTLVVVFGGLTLMLAFGYQQYDPIKDTITAAIGAALAKIVPTISEALQKKEE